MTAPLLQPPRAATEAGAPRRFGIELEMGGIGLDTASATVSELFGLSIEVAGRYERHLTGDPAGNWEIEVDSAVLKRMGRERRDPRTLSGGLGNSAEEAMARIAEGLVPVEIVSPPLPFERLAEVEALIVRLRESGARGTSDALLSAFGTQINAEAPATDAAAVTAFLRAFLCLYDWLFERARVNLSRRVTSFIDPFPTGYLRRLVDPAYAPAPPALIDDYIAANPTRNRALDLLPLLAHLDEARVRAALPGIKIKPRPAYHYRLPNCDIDQPGWGLHVPWNDWIEVERLADDPVRLAGCAAAYHARIRWPGARWLVDWAAEVERTWLGR